MQVARWALMRRFLSVCLSVCGRNANPTTAYNMGTVVASTLILGRKILEFLLNILIMLLHSRKNNSCQQELICVH